MLPGRFELKAVRDHSWGGDLALHDLERFGIAGNDPAVTAFVHRGVPRASTSCLQQAVGLRSASTPRRRRHRVQARTFADGRAATDRIVTLGVTPAQAADALAGAQRRD